MCIQVTIQNSVQLHNEMMRYPLTKGVKISKLPVSNNTFEILLVVPKLYIFLVLLQKHLV